MALVSLSLFAEQKTPETSSLFEKHIDPESMAVSYRLKKGTLAPCQQAPYFVNKSMTEDGRFLFFCIAEREWGAKSVKKRFAVIDFLQDKAWEIPFKSNGIPLVDIYKDRIYYVNASGVHMRDLLSDPFKEITFCPLPKDYLAEGELKLACTHLTMSHDGKKVFLDSQFKGPHWVWGTIDIGDGTWEKWGEEDNYPINHAQIHPFRNDIALCAHETSWTDREGKKVRVKNWNGVYPRLQLIEKGRRTMIPPANNYATHERWDEQGDGFYWCSGGVWYCDLESLRQTFVCPYGDHAMMSIDKNNVVSDDRIGPFYRGASWRVWFWDRTLSEGLYISYSMPGIGTPERPSRLHPDPHPHFVCADKYIVWTEMDPDSTMNVMVTPTAPLKELLSRKLIGNIPYYLSPLTVYRKLLRRIDISDPQDAFWQAVMTTSRRLGEKDIQEKLCTGYYKEYEGREDCSILALEAYMSNASKNRLHRQWEESKKFGYRCADAGKPESESFYERVLLQIDAWRVSSIKGYLDKAVQMVSAPVAEGDKAQHMAVAAMTLRYLDPSDKAYRSILKSIVSDAEKLRATQGKDGLWNGDADNSALYAYALAEALFHSWIDSSRFTPVLRAAWETLGSNAATSGEIGNAALMNLCNLLL